LDGHFGLVVLRFFVAGGIAVALAYLSRRYFEETFLQMKGKVQTWAGSQVYAQNAARENAA